MFNPSATGLNQHTTITVNARQQWYNFTDASIGRSSFNINKGFNDDGFGLEVFTDNSGNISNSGFKINYSRRVVIDSDFFVLWIVWGLSK